MSELKELEFLAAKSEVLLDKQITSYRQKHSNAATIITVLALFLPFFLSGLGDAYLILKFFTLLPVGILIYAIILLIRVLRSQPLDHGFNVDQFGDLHMDVVGHVVPLRTPARLADGQISLRSMSGPVDAVAIRSTAALVGLDQCATHDIFDRRQGAHELATAFAQGR